MNAGVWFTRFPHATPVNGTCDGFGLRLSDRVVRYLQLADLIHRWTDAGVNRPDIDALIAEQNGFERSLPPKIQHAVRRLADYILSAEDE